MPRTHPLVRDVDSMVGDALRCVAVYRESGYDLLYIRPDVEGRYTTDEMDRVHDDLVLQRIGTDFLEDLFHAGDLHCSILGFEEAYVFHVVGAPYEGLFVSVDATVDLSVPELVERLKGTIQAAV